MDCKLTGENRLEMEDSRKKSPEIRQTQKVN